MNKKDIIISLLAGCMMSYIFASLWYIYQTKEMPKDFNNSLTPSQKDLLCESSKKRKKVFMTGLMVGLVATIIIFLLLGVGGDDSNDTGNKYGDNGAYGDFAGYDANIARAGKRLYPTAPSKNTNSRPQQYDQFTET